MWSPPSFGLRSKLRKGAPQHLAQSIAAAADRDTLVVDWVNRGLVRANWGDAIAPTLVKGLSGRGVVNARDIINFRGRPVHTTIGSMLGTIDAPRVVVWGSGFVEQQAMMRVKPEKICAVRGPLTRARLLEAGVPCPELFGDPALLYPLLYQPPRTAEFELGIIPHFREIALPDVARLGRDDRVRIIDIRSGITEVADAIASCQRIASASLHGLVAGHAFGVPSRWVTFSDMPYGGGFKFRDYLTSVGHATENLAVDGTTSVDQILSEVVDRPIDLDTHAFLMSCPFLKDGGSDFDLSRLPGA